MKLSNLCRSYSYVLVALTVGGFLVPYSGVNAEDASNIANGVKAVTHGISNGEAIAPFSPSERGGVEALHSKQARCLAILAWKADDPNVHKAYLPERVVGNVQREYSFDKEGHLEMARRTIGKLDAVPRMFGKMTAVDTKKFMTENLVTSVDYVLHTSLYDVALPCLNPKVRAGATAMSAEEQTLETAIQPFLAAGGTGAAAISYQKGVKTLLEIYRPENCSAKRAPSNTCADIAAAFDVNLGLRDRENGKRPISDLAYEERYVISIALKYGMKNTQMSQFKTEFNAFMAEQNEKRPEAEALDRVNTAMAKALFDYYMTGIAGNLARNYQDASKDNPFVDYLDKLRAGTKPVPTAPECLKPQVARHIEMAFSPKGVPDYLKKVEELCEDVISGSQLDKVKERILAQQAQFRSAPLDRNGIQKTRLKNMFSEEKEK